MSIENSALKNIKSCLLLLVNKKAVSFDFAAAVNDDYLSIGYNFDKISFAAYDSQSEIVRAIKDCKENYQNIVICLPVQMEKTVKDYLSGLFGAAFDALGVLASAGTHVFTLFYDVENRLTINDIKATLDVKYGIKYDRSYIKTVGATKKEIDLAIQEARNAVGEEEHGLNFYVTDSYGDSKIEIVYSNLTPKMTVDGAIRVLLSRLNDYVYALEDITLAERLFQLLKLRRMKISVAESFTGGGICKKLVEVSGISEVFFEGLNTYSNEAKTSRLGVSELTLKQQGAVSAETCEQMATGLIRTGNCDIAISTTGIAGPKSDMTSKPVGLAFIGVATAQNVRVYKFNFRGGRETITKTAINCALFAAYKTIK